MDAGVRQPVGLPDMTAAGRAALWMDTGIQYRTGARTRLLHVHVSPRPLTLPSLSVCCSAACYLSLLRWEDALYDCDRAIQLKPEYVKAVCR